MKNIKIRTVLVAVTVLAATSTTTGCGLIKPFDKPELVTIEASQTAFLIPLQGDTANQASFESEALLAKAKVATKEVQIPHRWKKTGRMNGSGKWIPSAKLIIVERTPETREWNSEKGKGTSSKDQAIYAESKESIGFSVGMNCSAQIYNEDDAVKFLYSYNNKTLEDIMDTEIRARVESKFVEECAKYSLNEILAEKEKIMKTVRDDVTTYFEGKGITITVLGMKDGIEYDDATIQEAINEKFSSEQKLVTQENNNAVQISKAEASAKAKIVAAEAEAEANKKVSESLTPELIQKMQIEAWQAGGSQVPMVNGASGTIIDMGNMTNNTKEAE